MKIIKAKNSYRKLLEKNNIFIINNSSEEDWNEVMNIIHESKKCNYEYKNITGTIFDKRSIEKGEKEGHEGTYCFGTTLLGPEDKSISTLDFLENYIL